MEKQIAEKARRFRLWWLLVIILAAAASGCSSGGGAGTGVSRIAGRVTY